MKEYKLCCDWGTTFLRLRLINNGSNEIIGEVTSANGIANTFDAWKIENKTSNVSRVHFFKQQLKEQINILSKNIAIDLDYVDLLISGMASSSIGLEEIPYAELPFAVDGSKANVKHFELSEGFPHAITLISGIRSTRDVMRGEETQLIGMLALPELADMNLNEAVFIFPGTHSKHIYIQNRQVVNFETYMTGEVFNLMTQHSILKNSVEANHSAEFSESGLAPFKLGINDSLGGNILHNLFFVRTNELFDRLDKKQNSIYLSALLIGTELKHLIDNKSAQLVLCSGTNLHNYYQKAVDELDLSDRTIIIPSDVIDKSAYWGQMKIFEKLQLKTTTE